MPTFKVLPLIIGLSMATQVAQAADLMSIARDVLDNNASLAAARAGVDATYEGESLARSPLLPQVNASASASRTHTRGSGSDGANANASEAGVSATQALFDAKSWYQLDAAKLTAKQGDLKLANTRQQLLYQVASNYFEVLKAKDLLDTYRAQEEASARQLNQARQQFNVGVIAATDVREAEAMFDSSRAQRISQESVLQVQFEALEQLTGKQYPSIDGLDEALPIEAPLPSNRDAWIEMATTTNIALQAARAGIDVARANVKAAQAGHMPTLNAYANYSYNDTDRSQSSYTGNGAYSESNSIGVKATLPIYVGGATSASIRQNTFQLEQSQFQAEDQLRQAIQQVNSYFAKTNNDVLSVQARKQATVSSKASLEATRNGYEAGTRTILDVLTSQRAYYNALADYAASRYNYVLDLLALRQQAGVLDIDSLAAVNKWLHADRAVRFDGADMTTRHMMP